MKLSDIVKQLPKVVASGNLEQNVTHVTCDSRQVGADSVFVAIRGTGNDGHRYIQQAIDSGAAAIVAEKAPDEHGSDSVAWLHTSCTRRALSILADLVSGQPSAKLKLAGITGTNGKTTTSFLLHHILQTVHRRAGMLGTVWVDDGIESREATHTTPEAGELHRFLKTIVDNECRSAVMEVSSHGIDQLRVESVQFDVALFTNLTQDHLDYHKSMEAYYEAKKALFIGLKNQTGKKKPVAVINNDDAWGQKLIKDLDGSVPLITFGAGAHCDFKLGKFTQTIRTCEFELIAKGKSYLVRMPIFGRYNVFNAIGAIAAASAMGIRLRDAVQAVMQTSQVPGRLEWIASDEGVNVFVDYAHTPDALESVCSTLQELEPKRLITVFGCGGDRDQGKRPLMGKAASLHSDLCFVTSDNPRSENPESIIADIEPGMSSCPHRAILDRREAITTAVHLATAGDVVLIAGKGHEAYQEIAGEKLDFDDRKVAREAVRTRPLPDRVLRQREAEAKKKTEEYQKRRAGRDEEGGSEARGERREFKGRDDRGGDRRDSRGPKERRGGERQEFKKRDDRGGDRRGPKGKTEGRGDSRRHAKGGDDRKERRSFPRKREDSKSSKPSNDKLD